MASSKKHGVTTPQEFLRSDKDSLNRFKKVTEKLDSSLSLYKQTSFPADCSVSNSSSESTHQISSTMGSSRTTGQALLSWGYSGLSLISSSSKRQSTSRPRRIWDTLPAWTLEYQALTPIQQRVMEYVAATGEKESAEARARLKRSWGIFNISEEDLSAIEKYLAMKVPLTIRVDIQHLFPYLIQDPFYRTAFETMNKGTAYLESRRRWEGVLFNNLYEDPLVLPRDRPKYGVLNMVCNPFSDTRVSFFGAAYLLLKDSLRARVTVATSKENLGNYTRRVGTVDNLWHVLETLSPHEITRIHAVAIGRRTKATVSPDSKYSEIQIHGMLDMRKDVAAIVVQRKDLQSLTAGPLIQELSKMYILPVLTCEELDELLDDRRWSTVVNQRANLLFQKTMAMNDVRFNTSTGW